MSRIEELESALAGMADEEVLATFHELWFKSMSWQRGTTSYRSVLRGTIKRLVTLDPSEVDDFFEFATSSIGQSFPKSRKGEALKKKNPTFAKRVAKLFRYKLDDDIGYKPVRKIDCCFTQLDFLASGGFLNSSHLPALCELIEIEHPKAGSSRRWQILSLCADNSVIGFVRKMWDCRDELGHSDDSILSVLSNLETKRGLQTLLRCFLGTKKSEPWRDWISRRGVGAPSSYLLSNVERGVFLDEFFPALNPMINAELNDWGLLDIALKCREAGSLPNSSEKLVASHLDKECARLVAAVEELDPGDPDIFELRYPLGHCLRRACRLKHHPAMQRWFDWSMAHPMPEVRINVLVGMVEAGQRIPSKLLKFLGQSPICRPEVFSILSSAGKLGSVPSSFFTDEKLAESAVAIEREQDNCHYPPNRLRKVGVVELPTGRYVVMGHTAIEHWEPVTPKSAESLAIVGPMAEKPSLVRKNLPAVRVEHAEIDNSDLGAWVQKILYPKVE